MAIRYSDAAAALLAGDMGLRRVFANCHMVLYEGTQPTSANDTIGSSQPLISVTNSDGVWTAETRAQWKFTITNATASDTCTSVKIGGAAGTNAFDILGGTVTISDTNDTTAASEIAAAINANIANGGFTATSSSGAVTITAPKCSGAAFNTCIVIAAGSGLTFTYNDGGGTGAVFTTGVAAVNGLLFAEAANGTALDPAEDVFYIQKLSTQTWKGKNGFGPATAAASAVFSGIINGTTKTAGWGRLYASAGDDGSAATSGATGYIRMDFSVGTASPADAIMTPAATFLMNTASGSEVETVINSFRLKVDKALA